MLCFIQISSFSDKIWGKKKEEKGRHELHLVACLEQIIHFCHIIDNYPSGNSFCYEYTIMVCIIINNKQKEKRRILQSKQYLPQLFNNKTNCYSSFGRSLMIFSCFTASGCEPKLISAGFNEDF